MYKKELINWTNQHKTFCRIARTKYPIASIAATVSSREKAPKIDVRLSKICQVCLKLGKILLYYSILVKMNI